jgi:hypothetical protein
MPAALHEAAKDTESLCMRESGSVEPPQLSALRVMVVLILLLGVLGAGVELLLLGHTEDWRQWIPLALQGSTVAVLVWHFAERGPRSTRAIQLIMIAFIVAGLAGVYYHLQGSAEFKLESNPSLAGWALFWEAMRGKNPPSLAPGVMVQLGLLGLAYTYRHPALMKPGKMRHVEGELR